MFKNNKGLKGTTILKEVQNLLQRFIIIARIRLDLDLEDCIGEYEFGVVPKTLFAASGFMVLEKQKGVVACVTLCDIVLKQNQW